MNREFHVASATIFSRINYNDQVYNKDNSNKVSY